MKTAESAEPLAKFIRIAVAMRRRLGIGSLESMKSSFWVLFAGNRVDFGEVRTHRSPDNLAKLRTALSCSADQLDQLVGKQGDDAKHEVEPDFLASPHHHVAAPKLFFQPTVEGLRHRPFLVPGRLMGCPRDNLSPPAIPIDD